MGLNARSSARAHESFSPNCAQFNCPQPMLACIQRTHTHAGTNWHPINSRSSPSTSCVCARFSVDYGCALKWKCDNQFTFFLCVVFWRSVAFIFLEYFLLCLRFGLVNANEFKYICQQIRHMQLNSKKNIIFSSSPRWSYLFPLISENSTLFWFTEFSTIFLWIMIFFLVTVSNPKSLFWLWHCRHRRRRRWRNKSGSKTNSKLWFSERKHVCSSKWDSISWRGHRRRKT